MVKSTYKYSKEQIQQWLILSVLIFSVFIFTGFNQQAHAAFNQPTQTELAEARVSNPAFSYRSFVKKPNTKASFSSIVFTSNILLSPRNFRLADQLLNTKFKSLKQKTLLFNLLSINVQRRICNNTSDEDDLSFNIQ